MKYVPITLVILIVLFCLYTLPLALKPFTTKTTHDASINSLKNKPFVYDGSLPDPAKTPGSVNPEVTQDNIQSTICKSGWTSTIRPTSAFTTVLKKKQLENGYTVNGDTNPINYEEDHLISLELGGSPTDEKNLWPESYKIKQGARVKDRVENYLKRQVCNNKMLLIQAQYFISHDWISVYEQKVKT